MPSGSAGSLAFECYGVNFENASARMVAVLVDPDGAKIDFECYARSGAVAWDDLLSGKIAEASEVRVIISLGSYYQQAYTDEEKWLHLRTTSPDLPETLDFYLDRANPAAAEVSEAASKPCRATLSVRAVDDSAKHRQFEIVAVKSLSWVEPD